ncbi:unnamed protein product [Echinostoma caproni]|uniref:HAGH_C domain-containing protein n=1 Tax=Echinostoma caproni TaxID=27848 RepID=A0A183A2M2_9TREM|nr:unnamed protein product [Echinostoma caproni]
MLYQLSYEATPIALSFFTFEFTHPTYRGMWHPPVSMYKALQGTLAKLPGETKVYCGHEYTVKNLQFGLTVEPNNATMKQRLDEMQRLRAANTPTVPGTIAEELLTNPFMRVTEASVLAHAKTQDPIEAMRVIRQEKDRF